MIAMTPTGFHRTVLGDIAKISSGGTPSRIVTEYWNGEIPWIKTAQIQNGRIGRNAVDEWITDRGLRESSAKMTKAGNILMAMYGQGKTRGQVAILDIDASINQACAAIELNDSADRDYVFQFLLSRYERIRQMSNTGGQENLSSGLIKEIPILLPPLPEQKAIADILSTWDAAIEKTERLIKAKERRFRGLMQELIGRNQVDWFFSPLGDLFSEVVRKVGEKTLAPYSISAGKGFVSQQEKWGKDISGAQHQSYTHLKSGEFSYNKGNSRRYKQGCAYLLKEKEVCVPNVFISFKPKAKNIILEFYEQYFIGDYHAKELKRYITSGARADGLLNLKKKDFFKILVPHPPVEDQILISEILTYSRREIEVLQSLADHYKTQKRGLMQKLLTGEWRVNTEIVITDKEVL